MFLLKKILLQNLFLLLHAELRVRFETCDPAKFQFHSKTYDNVTMTRVDPDHGGDIYIFFAMDS